MTFLIVLKEVKVHVQHDGVVLKRQLENRLYVTMGKMTISCVLSTYLGFCQAKRTVGSESHQILSHGAVAICSHPKMGRFILNDS